MIINEFQNNSLVNPSLNLYQLWSNSIHDDSDCRINSKKLAEYQIIRGSCENNIFMCAVSIVVHVKCNMSANWTDRQAQFKALWCGSCAFILMLQSMQFKLDQRTFAM